VKLDFKGGSAASLIASVLAFYQGFALLAVVAMIAGAVGVFAPKDKTTIGFRWLACAGFVIGLIDIVVAIGANR
jgi:hypothetical protein